MIIQLILGFIFAGLSFPLLLTERVFPRTPLDEKLEWDNSAYWTHNVLNNFVEHIRADSQYWGKFLSFAIILLVLINLI